MKGKKEKIRKKKNKSIKRRKKKNKHKTTSASKQIRNKNAISKGTQSLSCDVNGFGDDMNLHIHCQSPKPHSMGLTYFG
jgi:hypothetical protein